MRTISAVGFVVGGRSRYLFVASILYVPEDLNDIGFNSDGGAKYLINGEPF